MRLAEIIAVRERQLEKKLELRSERFEYAGHFPIRNADSWRRKVAARIGKFWLKLQHLKIQMISAHK